MADVVAAPEHHVVADVDERLDRVVLEDEAVLADDEIGPRRRLRADVGNQPITALLRLPADAGSDLVDAPVADSDEHRVVRGRVALDDLLECDYRAPGQDLLAEVLAVDRERDRIVRTVVLEVVRS